ncbi:hypothetical protein N9Y60_01270 [Crocinitomicaceae bacterium]|nr:hypothetical protein [Crocinitomicaceae bacterium]
MTEDPENKREPKDDPTNWNGWYMGLIAALAFQIIVYLLITNMYSK